MKSRLLALILVAGSSLTPTSWSRESSPVESKRLPGSLDDALKALEADHDFLLEGDVFSEELLQQWVDYKREMEYYAVRNRPHPYEVTLYFDV